MNYSLIYLLLITSLLTSCSRRVDPPAPVSYGYNERASDSPKEVQAPSPSTTSPSYVSSSTRRIEQETLLQEDPLPPETPSSLHKEHRKDEKPKARNPKDFDKDFDSDFLEEESEKIAPPQKPSHKKVSAIEREKELEKQFTSLEKGEPSSPPSKLNKPTSAKKGSNTAEEDSPPGEDTQESSLQDPNNQLAEKKPFTSSAKESLASRNSSFKFIWPIKGEIISQFNQKKGKIKNDGINIAAQKNTPVVATEEGVVVYEGNEMQGFGNLILLKHPGGWMSAYGHCSKIFVKRGQRVRQGDQIALVGDTGSVRSPQLHFQLRKKATVVDPLQYLE